MSFQTRRGRRRAPKTPGHRKASQTQSKPTDAAAAEHFAPQGLGPAGLYDGLNIVDETGTFGDLAYADRTAPVSEVILHQTDSSTADSTRDAYSSRIRAGEHIGAHYLIDEDGNTSLTVPTDRIVGHTVDHNNAAVGIETVGLHTNLSGSTDLHSDVGALDLAPDLRARLLGLSPEELRREMADNGNNIYEDITGPQKRANWNLLSALGSDHGLDLTTAVDSHEHVQAKTLGEGENTEEMVTDMLAWPEKIAELELQLAAAQSHRDIMVINGVDYLDDLAPMEALLESEKAKADAVNRDGTAAENNALEAETILGEGGPATDREALRVSFWDNFHPNMAELDDALSPDRVANIGPLDDGFS